MNNIIDTKEEKPLANFLKKEKVSIPKSIITDTRVHIPPMYYWEEVYNGQSVLMTMAFKWHNKVYGMSYPIDEKCDTIRILRSKLFEVVKESMDVLVHHGDLVLDTFGNIDPKKVNEQEAIRFKFDPQWDKKVAAFNKLIKIMPITKKKAEELKLL